MQIQLLIRNSPLGPILLIQQVLIADSAGVAGTSKPFACCMAMGVMPVPTHHTNKQKAMACADSAGVAGTSKLMALLRGRDVSSANNGASSSRSAVTGVAHTKVGAPWCGCLGVGA